MKFLCVLLASSLPLTVLAQGKGVPVSGFPNADERLVLVLVNRARADPQTELADCTVCGEAACYKPATPVVWAYELNRSARFHSANMRQIGFAHDSKCQLVQDISQKYPPNGTCMGDAACACVGGTATGTTSWTTRIGLFGGSPSGENIALGYGSPRGVFYAWLYEPDSDPTCGFRYTNGHRKNILENGPALGVGEDQSSWTQDFGYSASLTDALVAGANEGNDFYANWYEAQGAAPSSARVNIDGACSAMTLERGTNANGTWKATVAGSGCRHYTFEFVDASGALHVLPETGAYQDGCATDYDPAPFAHCGQPPIAADAGTSGSTDAGSASSGADAGGGAAESPDGGASMGSGSNGAPGSGSTAANDPDPSTTGNASGANPPSAIEGTFGCSAGTGSAPLAWLLIALAIALVLSWRAAARRR